MFRVLRFSRAKHRFDGIGITMAYRPCAELRTGKFICRIINGMSKSKSPRSNWLCSCYSNTHEAGACRETKESLESEWEIFEHQGQGLGAANLAWTMYTWL
jgi:hypothetical protein